jgi:integrase
VNAASPWDELRTAVGRPDLQIHDLRHTFATILFDAGASAPDVQATLGHSSLQATEPYSRAREGVALRAGAALNDALKSAAGEPSQRTRRRTPDINGTLMAQPRRDPGGISR